MLKSKKYVRVVIVSLIVILAGTICSFGRNIGTFEHFRVGSYSWSTTSSETKTTSGKYYVLNLRDTKYGYLVRHCVVNSDGDRRSSINKMFTGEREERYTWAHKSYYYSLELQRSGYSPFSIYVYGSWSPDR